VDTKEMNKLNDQRRRKTIALHACMHRNEIDPKGPCHIYIYYKDKNPIDPMFINDRRIWGLTLMTRILFRGWNLPDWQAVLSSKRCNGVSCGSAGAGDSTIFFPFWIAFNRNILYWEICHGQV
jgi:hypothetical protein